MTASYQERLGRVRPPRVQLTYQVDTGEAMEERELPFVLGVMGDFRGHIPADAQEPGLSEPARNFINVDRDSLDHVLKGLKPALSLTVANRLTQGQGGEGESLKVALTFESLQDFEPLGLTHQVEPLRRLLEMRGRLSELLARLEGNEPALERLEGLLGDPSQLRALGSGSNTHYGPQTIQAHDPIIIPPAP